MEFIQRKTADRAVNHFLLKAADQEITVAWDRFEGQLPVSAHTGVLRGVLRALLLPKSHPERGGYPVSKWR